MPEAKNIVTVWPSAFTYHFSVSSVLGHNDNKRVCAYNIFSDAKHFNVKLYLTLTTGPRHEMQTHQIICI